MTERLPVHQVVAKPGMAEALQELANSSVTGRGRSELEDILSNAGAREPITAVDDLLEYNLLEQFGDRLGISLAGIRTSLLIQALNGADIEAIWGQLRRVTGSAATYELVREGMTKLFVQSLVDRPGFGRLYFCSPWVNPSQKEGAMLKYAVMREERQSRRLPEVIVVTRPPDVMPPEARGGLAVFREIGAKIYFHRRLHSKLYIREPGPAGGLPMAILGSQNLTRSDWLELGIRINGDSQLIAQLMRYFLDLMSWSSEDEGES